MERQASIKRKNKAMKKQTRRQELKQKFPDLLNTFEEIIFSEKTKYRNIILSFLGKRPGGVTYDKIFQILEAEGNQIHITVTKKEPEAEEPGG